MESISKKARVGPLSIGLRRSIALRLLLLLGKLRPVVALFHPRNTHGILIGVTLMAFLLRRFGSVRSRAESAYRRKFWGNMMKAALTYEEWAHAARMMEREKGKEETNLYDEELVRSKVRELRRRREDGSMREIVFSMRADLLRNLGNMCNPNLHKGRLQVSKTFFFKNPLYL